LECGYAFAFDFVSLGDVVLEIHGVE
jgi:hypothetical protein